MSARPPFTLPVTVRFSEIDVAGVVFNSHYLTWCEDAKVGFLDSIGYDPARFAAEHHLALVRHAEIDWVVSLRPLDRAEIRVTVDRVGTSSFTLRHEIWRTGADPALTASCVITYVWFDTLAGTKIPLDEHVRGALSNA
ncbi:acyl-CoA thioesterase [Terracoccus luteus]|uniref:Acyl-CoA thioester hydrolase n=1 Tax=Terracoccus luteus TaxID=53356 RepID=A0A839PSC0_9MICO|nr:thioesterase family protein [Terracoccus luteus]MBB2984886.1 acyl-CoA thioester hydrolase [Terracoccus luteus]MCP2170538.1 acyl-CoA thioester hydrolase [Terracoccus luteus]